MVSYARIVRNLTTDQHALLSFKHQITNSHNILANNWTTDYSSATGSASLALLSTVDELRQLSRLEHIDLNSNLIDGEIPLWFGRLDEVLDLILRSNNLTGLIPPSISNMSSLENLDLNHNLIHGNINCEISKLANLRIHRLAHNRLSGPIPKPIYGMSSLRMISQPLNNLSGSLPENICRHLPDLEAFFLEENEL
ncbi:Leucine-rich receptor protein kinase family protein [Hibiscus syriacus]|uniref:Leucine-rich receptor protein kinase family protein n=1 Tax=Hibiscus syriacus TaxID=106335 RepID=A0A6A3AYX6_HIBSY|nr:Leucine-rich receptor protein kinase family protein [Hibiscus syriacus]